MKQYLTARIQALSQSDLQGIVDPDILRRIKEDDPNPDIRVYSIGHEGKSNLHLPGIGDKTLTWIQAAVQWISDKLKLGTAVFDRHDPNTNSHEGRVQIGEVVGKVTKTIKDRLNTLAAIHVFSQYKSRPLDVASIEAEIEYDHDSHQAWPTRINNISGVALGSSDNDQPGFPGATLLGAVQAFVQANVGDIGETKMNKSDVKEAVKELRLRPSELFELDDIMSDKSVRADMIGKNTRLEKERDDARAKVDKLGEDNAGLQKTIDRAALFTKSAPLIEQVLSDPERKLDDKAKAYVQRSMKVFTSEADNEDALKVDVVRSVDAAVKDYGEVAKLMGVKVDENTNANLAHNLPNEFNINAQQNAANQPHNATQQAGTQEPTTRDDVLHSEMNPDTNPFIPGGKAALEASKT